MKHTVLFMLLLLLLISIIIVSSLTGPVPVKASNVIRILASRPFSDARLQDTARLQTDVLLKLRLPRIMLALLTGWALGLAGAALQGLFRNPLADPYVIGVSSGASLGAALIMLYPTGILMLSGMAAQNLAAFAGGLASVILVFAIAGNSRKAPPIVSILLAGTAVSAFMSSTVTFLMVHKSRDIHRIFYWLLGSFNTVGWDAALSVLAAAIIGTSILLACAKSLDLLSFGEESAANSGVPVTLVRWLTVLAASLMTAAAVSVCGIIAFAGLIAPHICRLLFGPGHLRLFPAAGLAGAILLILADLVSRTIVYPVELPVGVITSLLGAPFFLYLLKTAGRRL